MIINTLIGTDISFPDMDRALNDTDVVLRMRTGNDVIALTVGDIRGLKELLAHKKGEESPHV